MKAIVQRGYGAPEEVLELREIDVPAMGDDDVRVRVRAASVHADVWHVILGVPYLMRLMGNGLRRPVYPVPGTDLAGVVEAVGRNVTRFRPGDEVFGDCGRAHQWLNGGTWAEQAVVPARALEPKPAGVPFEQAATVPTSGLIALRCLRVEGRLRAGQRVLVNGAAGAVGALGVQIAKAAGAEVTGVDRPGKLDAVRALGADRVIDCTRDDFTRGPDRYDLILDIPGNHRLSECRRALAPDGTYVLVGHDHYGTQGRRWLGGVPRALGQVAISPFVRQLPRPATLREGVPPLADLRELLAAGRLTPVIDRAFPLAEAARAIRYLAEGNASGRIVVTP